jgi:hypothetical protein
MHFLFCFCLPSLFLLSFLVVDINFFNLLFSDNRPNGNRRQTVTSNAISRPMIRANPL